MNVVGCVSDTPCVAFVNGRWRLYTERNIPASEDGPERDVLTYEVLEGRTVADALAEAADWLGVGVEEIGVVAA